MDPLKRIEKIISALVNEYRLSDAQQDTVRRCLLHIQRVDGELSPAAVALLESLVKAQVELQALVQQAEYLRKRFARLLEQKERQASEFTRVVQQLLENYPDLLGQVNAAELAPGAYQDFEALKSLVEKAPLPEPQPADEDEASLAPSEYLLIVTEYGLQGEADAHITVVLSASSEYLLGEDLRSVLPRELRQAVAYRLELAGPRVRVFRSPDFSIRQNEAGVHYAICTASICALPYGNRQPFWAKPLQRAEFERLIAIPLDAPLEVHRKLLALLEKAGLNAESPEYRSRAASQVTELAGAMSGLEYCSLIR